ncbi:hypothetical protein CDL12_24161 [Handroanthus impetiginosus]|uniref:Dof zinc finger protein n=1 Tax=Handroanthus impetiginosus TaxID=429701 RepID=A0A2G9GDF8_9LAMI|nr:hypothetical protein CDL12_24161 [Handroanthus impetiginosus]
MVFSSIPAYLDPSNWQQQIIGNATTNPLLAPPPPPPPPQPHGGGSTGSIRPGSMSERARLANIPMPESALKCPRCESTNTKFCYFNNYSLSQPRHFCKTCRRYWTRGGALRNVPVGGGCRRNKRSKSTTSSKSPGSSDRQTSSTSSMSTSTNTSTANVLGLTPPPIRFMSPLSQLNENFTSEMGLNYGGISSPAVGTNEMNFHGGGGISSLLSSGGATIEPWRQQFPFLGGLDPSPGGIYQFHGSESGFVGSESTRPKFLSSSLLSQAASVKMEGLQGNDDQWINSSAAWTELSNFSSSSTSNHL